MSNCSFTVSAKKITYFDERDFKIKSVKCGIRHSIVLTEDGKVFTFGDNTDSQCSGFSIFNKEPVQVKFTGNEIIKEIFAGGNFSLAVNKKDEIFSWGDTSFDKLGFHAIDTKIKVPKQIPFLAGRHINNIYTGHEQIVISLGTKQNCLIKT